MGVECAIVAGTHMGAAAAGVAGRDVHFAIGAADGGKVLLITGAVEHSIAGGLNHGGAAKESEGLARVQLQPCLATHLLPSPGL